MRTRAQTTIRSASNLTFQRCLTANSLVPSTSKLSSLPWKEGNSELVHKNHIKVTKLILSETQRLLKLLVVYPEHWREFYIDIHFLLYIPLAQ